LPISHVLGVIFDDIDDTILAFTVMPEGGGILPAWATITADTLVCTPQVDDTCIINIVITAIDLAGATASDTFEVLIDGYIVNIGDLGDGLFEVQMYPNPTQGLVNLDINLSQIFDTEISVMNIAGEEIFRKRYKAQEQIRFDLSKHVSGMYMVTLKIDGNQIVKKLILDRK